MKPANLGRRLPRRPLKNPRGPRQELGTADTKYPIHHLHVGDRPDHLEEYMTIIDSGAHYTAVDAALVPADAIIEGERCVGDVAGDKASCKVARLIFKYPGCAPARIEANAIQGLQKRIGSAHTILGMDYFRKVGGSLTPAARGWKVTCDRARGNSNAIADARVYTEMKVCPPKGRCETFKAALDSGTSSTVFMTDQIPVPPFETGRPIVHQRGQAWGEGQGQMLLPTIKEATYSAAGCPAVRLTERPVFPHPNNPLGIVIGNDYLHYANPTLEPWRDPPRMTCPP